MNDFMQGEVFEGKDWEGANFSAHEFDDCVFRHCKLSGADLREAEFTSCRFEQCDLSNVLTEGTSLKDVHFEECKLIGMDFSICKDFLFEVNFLACQLDLALFHDRKLPKVSFERCSLKDAAFFGASLPEADFSEADLKDCQFSQCDLRKADFRTAKRFRIDPDDNRLRGARFAMDGLPGLLDKYGIRIG